MKGGSKGLSEMAERLEREQKAIEFGQAIVGAQRAEEEGDKGDALLLYQQVVLPYLTKKINAEQDPKKKAEFEKNYQSFTAKVKELSK